MATETKTKKKKATEVVFDVIKMLILIQSDKDLLEMFNSKYATDIKLSIALAKEGLLKSEAKKYVKGMFENIVLKRKELLDAYMSIDTDTPIEVKSDKEDKKKLPRRYGKTEILKDVKDQGGKMNEFQRMGLKVNDLKNTYAKLNRLAISNMLGETTLTDEQARDIIAAINTLETKIKKVL